MPARLYLIDSFNFIFRAYYARARSNAPPMRTATGIPTEAVYIFHNMVRKIMNEHKPEYLAAIFESSDGTSFRDTAYADYKKNRTETPNELLEQIPWVRRTLLAMGLPIIEASGYEHPHGHIALEAPGKTWSVVLAPPSRMENRGLTSAALKPGTTATVFGYPNRTKPEEMRAERITIDGKTVELR